jgi:hypothetical protein
VQISSLSLTWLISSRMLFYSLSLGRMMIVFSLSVRQESVTHVLNKLIKKGDRLLLCSSSSREICANSKNSKEERKNIYCPLLLVLDLV